MKILFEDRKEDRLSALFRRSLPEDIKAMLEYTEGNGRLPRKASNFSAECVQKYYRTRTGNRLRSAGSQSCFALRILTTA